MSYSFQFRASDKAAAKAELRDQLDQVIAAQPVHEVDRQLAEQTAGNFIDLLPASDSHDVAVSVSGSVVAPTADPSPTLVSCNVTASLVPRQ